MNKAEFLERIKEKIAHLPYEDMRRYLDFYAEMIEDRMEEGISEEDAVATMELPEVIAERILEEAGPVMSQAQEGTKAKRNRHRLWFLPLVLLLLLVTISIHIAAVGVAGSGVGFGAVCVWAAVKEGVNPALIMGGMMLVCAGLFLLLLPACKALRRAVSRCMKWTLRKDFKEVTEE